MIIYNRQPNIFPFPSGHTVLKNQIPDNKPCTQPNGPPKHRLCRTPPLRRTLQLAIALADIRRCQLRVGDQLRDELFLRGEVGD